MKVLIEWSVNKKALFETEFKQELFVQNSEIYQEETLTQNGVQILLYWVKNFDIDGFWITLEEQFSVDWVIPLQQQLRNFKVHLAFLMDSENLEIHVGSSLQSSLYETFEKIEEGTASALSLSKILTESSSATLSSLFLENGELYPIKNVLKKSYFPSLVFLFSLKGVPVLYNGQEWGFLRNEFPIPWTKLKKKNKHIHRFYKQLCKIRFKHAALRLGQTFLLPSPRDSLLVFVKSYRDDAVLVALNFSDQPYEGNIEIPEVFRKKSGSLNLKPFFKMGFLESKAEKTGILKLPAWGYEIWYSK